MSSSVRGERLERLRQAAGALVGLLTPQDRATLVTFDHEVTLGPRDASPHALDARLAAIAAGGRTALVDAVTAALVWGGGRERPMLILAFSDGRDTASWTRADQALALARSSDAVVDAVVTGELLPTSAPHGSAAVGMPAALTPDERFLADLAAQTGGRVRNGEAGAGLAGAFRDALEQFRGRYEITYTATARSRAGMPSRCACPAGAAPASMPGAAISADRRSTTMLRTLVLVAAIAAQTPAARTPYIDAVASYGPGTERKAVAALLALRLRDVDRVFEEIDRVCATQGARTCMPRDLEKAGPDVRDRVAGTWRQLYPRVMAVHAEALVAAGTMRDGTGVALHSGVLLRLAARCDEIARRAGVAHGDGGPRHHRATPGALGAAVPSRRAGPRRRPRHRRSGEVPGRGSVARARGARRAAGRVPMPSRRPSARASAAVERRGAMRESARPLESAPTEVSWSGKSSGASMPPRAPTGRGRGPPRRARDAPEAGPRAGHARPSGRGRSSSSRRQ